MQIDMFTEQLSNLHGAFGVYVSSNSSGFSQASSTAYTEYPLSSGDEGHAAAPSSP